MYKVRPLNIKSESEKDLIAKRMRLTLIDVMGEEKGSDFYPSSFFKERLEWHLNLEDKCGVLVCESEAKDILSHVIVRVEKDSDIHYRPFGFFSTIYVVPKWRRKGIARLMINEVHKWCLERNLSKVTYSTAINNDGLLSLLKELKYVEFKRAYEMVSLVKSL